MGVYAKTEIVQEMMKMMKPWKGRRERVEEGGGGGAMVVSGRVDCGARRLRQLGLSRTRQREQTSVNPTRLFPSLARVQHDIVSNLIEAHSSRILPLFFLL